MGDVQGLEIVQDGLPLGTQIHIAANLAHVVHISFQSGASLEHNVIGAFGLGRMLNEAFALDLLGPNVRVTAKVNCGNTILQFLLGCHFFRALLQNIPLGGVQQ